MGIADAIFTVAFSVLFVTGFVGAIATKDSVDYVSLGYATGSGFSLGFLILTIVSALT